MKKALMVTAALTAIVVMSLATVAINYVRWNDQINECVYFYDKADGARGQCFVAESNCDSMNPYTNEQKDVDPVGCYSVPRSQQTNDCKSFVEGEKIILKYQGSDPDADIGPAGKLVYTFQEPFDQDGTWQTTQGDAGDYTTEVTVSDGQYNDTATVCFTVLPANHPPVLTVSDVTANEGDTVTLAPTCTDTDGDAVKISYSGDLTGPVFNPSYDDAGIYNVKVTCTDANGATDAKNVRVTVLDVNRPPVLSGLQDVTVQETETVRLAPTCTDPEGDGVKVTYSGKMNASTWTTGYDDSGVYTVKVTCADASGQQTSQDVKVTVIDKNRAPTITAMVTAG